MRYVVVDLEASCWDKGHTSDEMEIIEIGAVLLADSRGPDAGEFARFVRPVVETTLSDFCKTLTTIRQEEVEAAEPFPTVFAAFVAWIGDDPFTLCSWGAYDLKQFRTDCARHHMSLPESFERHINLKAEFGRLFAVKNCGMRGALAMAGFELEGTHHRGIDDARNIARLAQLILPRLEETTIGSSDVGG